MGIIAHRTSEDALQSDGTRNVVYEFTFSEGPIVYRGPKNVPGDFDDDADRLALIPVVEAEEKEKELFWAEEQVLAEVDFSVIIAALLFNTAQEAGGWICKRMSNRVPEVTAEILNQHLPSLLAMNKIFVNYTDTQIAGWMGVQDTSVATWRSSFTTMRTGIVNYATPFGIFTDVPEE